MTIHHLQHAIGDGYVYLASPYTAHPNGLVSAWTAVCEAAAHLISRGVPTYAPIAHSHPVADCGGLAPDDHTIWLPADEPLLKRASALCILEIDGYMQSKGVDWEVARAQQLGLEIFTMFPDSFRVLYAPHITEGGAVLESVEGSG